jgi:hypothetical protein
MKHDYSVPQDRFIGVCSQQSDPRAVENAILPINRRYFLGKLMLPEFTYGKLMLPARPFFASIIFSLQAKSGKLMLPSVAILWVK